MLILSNLMYPNQEEQLTLELQVARELGARIRRNCQGQEDKGFLEECKEEEA